MRQPLAEMSVLGRTPRTSPEIHLKIGLMNDVIMKFYVCSSSGIFDKFVLHKIVVTKQILLPAIVGS